MHLFGDKRGQGDGSLKSCESQGDGSHIFYFFFPNFLLKVIRNGHIIIGGFYHA